MGVAPMTVSPFARWLITAYDWRTAMLTIGIAAWCLLIPAALLVRRAAAAWRMPRAHPALGQQHRYTVTRRPGVSFAAVHRAGADLLLLLLRPFRADLPHGELRHPLRRAADGGGQHLQRRGPVGLGGRLLLGVLGDRFGAKPVLVGGLLRAGAVHRQLSLCPPARRFYALAVVFGAAYGGVMPLYAVLAREYFGPRIMGTVFGAATMASSLGMAIGPLAGGFIFDTFHAYTWLYVAASLVGLGAVGMALAFPPQPSRLKPIPQLA